ncbi:S9 family peptidase [Balneolaceae bacterium YR4-1]|uniref:S9 family peptidase n=1 Tax=Halalkalibaculum roseum TaxID=2709311 RepID=A0A6M1SZE9_9BACT|nr:S9 family peptidase [Halalkalibaculum roseum]NGP77748.1 S9 family peptidase [Halalkalibaculum roseum]
MLVKKRSACSLILFILLFVSIQTTDAFQQSDLFALENVFDLEYASDPQIAPGGDQIVYVRNFMDIMDDRRKSNLWIINVDGPRHRPLTSGNANNFSPRWSPDGSKLLYASTESSSTELYIRWMDTGHSAKITNLTHSPGGLSWSPDGSMIAFTMFVPKKDKPLASLPGKPDGAEWANPAKVIDKLKYRADGAGYLEDGYSHVFVVPAEGGTPRQITSGEFNHGGSPQWTPDGEHLIISANRHENWRYDPNNSEVYKVSVSDGSVTALTDRKGPDSNPVISPDGSQIAYTGYDEKYEGYQVSKLYVMNSDGSDSRLITGNLDRNVGNVQWVTSGNQIHFQYDNEGNTRVATVTMDGEVQDLAENVGGTSIGRPYASGSFTVASNGTFAYTHTRPSYPADVAVAARNQQARKITQLNEDLFGHKKLGEVEEVWYESSYDGRKIQGWIVKPPNFDPDKTYPMLLEIHGGPFANYGDRFSAEVQLYAAEGYVVLYTNPRGSSGYGKEFGNLIHHNYPSQDYDDLMSGVDAVLEKGYVDEDRLYITGGSGGGVLTAWAIGKTDRFKAAVVAKPVINWYSFVLTADNPSFFYKYWFPGLPWNNLDHYMERSPISLVGNVTTPTMLLTGEEDYRTPMSETEQYYTALKLKKVESVMVRIPGSGHGIASRPSQLMTKVAHILEWFERY